jgi:hypothetical protein
VADRPRVEGEDRRGAELLEVDLRGALLREVDLSGASLRGVVLDGADIDGSIAGLRVNGVEIAPLVEAELDRRHPERRELRPTDAAGLRRAWDVVEEMWRPTLDRAERLPEDARQRRVDGEWSVAETLRHLVFVIDAWLGHAVLGEERPFHPLALPATFFPAGPELGIDPEATPSWAEVLGARRDRMDRVRRYVDALTDADVERPCGPNPAPGWPPPAERTVLRCLRVVLSEEWEHHRFAVRDLAVIETDTPPG